MKIITKVINNKKYAYFVKREGNKVLHKYLGSVNNPAVAKIIQSQAETASVPAGLSYLFWDTRIENIQIKQHSRYIISRILELGYMKAVKWMQRVYPVSEIVDVLFLSRTLDDKTRNFWNLWFEVVNV